MNFDTATDADISHKVAEYVADEMPGMNRADIDRNGVVTISTYFGSFSEGRVVDYCNSPADAWPIMLGLMDGGKELRLTTQRKEYLSGVHSNDENPLRACMIIYLKMQEAEQ